MQIVVVRLPLAYNIKFFILDCILIVQVLFMVWLFLCSDLTELFLPDPLGPPGTVIEGSGNLTGVVYGSLVAIY